MIFTDEFFDKLPSDLTKALELFYSTYMTFHSSIPSNKEIDFYEDYIDAYFAIEALIRANKLEDKYILLTFNINDREGNLELIKDFYIHIGEQLSSIKNEDIIESSRFKYNSKINNIFCYKFTDGDLNRIQELINELRVQINDSDLFSLNHKERLLNRLESLQKELHKRMSNLDKFWGLIGDAGIVIGKFGNDVKPMVDRMKEIAEIVWRTQASTEELPSGTSIPMLSDDNK